MCVALPGKAIEIKENEAVIDFNGNQVTAKTGLVEVQPGDYVLVHAGCVLQKVSSEEAESLTELMKEVDAFS